MPVKIKPRPTTKPSTPVEPSSTSAAPLVATPSTLQVMDIPDELLIDHEDNPNEQDDTTFDRLCQQIREDGFDEPLTVVPSLREPGKYLIFSGHHRRKAGKVIGMASFPAVVKEGWDEDKVAMELVSRNVMRGRLNPEKFTKLVEKLRTRGYDQALIQAQMGFTKTDEFEKLYKQVSDALPPAARKKLASVKENIKSVDGLSSAINHIFTEHGSDLKHGFIVFDFGGKQHHYVPTDKELHLLMEKLEQRCRDENLNISDLFKNLLRDTNAVPTRPQSKVIAVSKVAPRKLVRPNGTVQAPPPTTH